MSRIIAPYRFAAEASNGLLAGLESYWKLDEASGTIADAHGANDGTNNGAAYGATGIINDALDFESSDSDYVDIGTAFRFAYTQAFSISCWVNMESDGGSYAIISNQESSGNFRGWGLERDSSNRVMLVMRSGAGSVLNVRSTSGFLASAGLTHIAITCDGSGTAAGVTHYIDGSSVAQTTFSDTLSATPTYAVNTCIGANNGGSSNNFDGIIDEVGIWSRELSATDVTNLYNSGSGLSYDSFDYSGEGLLTSLDSYWKLDEASGTIADSHGANDGTLTGATYGATGVINDAIDFDGTGDYITIGDVLDFDYNEPFSIQAWYKPNSAGSDNHFIVSKQEDSGNFRGYSLWRGGSGQSHRVLWEIVSTGSNLLSFKGTTQLTNTSKWYHILATYDGSGDVSGMTLYIDGVSESSTSTTNSLSTTTVNAVDLTIGARITGQETDGLIDEVGIWSRELSATDVTNLYNSGSGLSYDSFDYSGAGLLTSLDSYYKLDEASGTIVDAHGANDGTNNGAAYGATGIINDALDFESSDSDYVDIGTAFRFAYTQAFSISCWVNMESDGGSYAIISNQESSGNFRGWGLERDSSNRVMFVMRSGAGSVLNVRSTSGFLASAGLTHIAITYDGSGTAAGVTHYIDGSSVAQTTFSDTLSATPTYAVNTCIGATNGGSSNNFDGIIDEIGIWSKELTALEVLNLYKGGAGMPYSEFES